MEVQFNALTLIQHPIIVAVQQANRKVEELQRWHKLVEQNASPDGFTIKEGMIFFQDIIFVPQLPSLKREIFIFNHEMPTYRHRGILKTYKDISKKNYWKNMRT